VGKASSTKKAARVARQTSGKKVRSSQGLVFPLALGVVLLIGLGLVVYARSSRPGTNSTVPPTLNDHWHTAYGIWGCDSWLPAIQNQTDDIDGRPIGIHTHGDGVIHVHPFTSEAAGENAKLGVFLKTSGLKLSNDKLEQPEVNKTYKNGDDCKGKPGSLKVLVWDNANTAGSTDPKVYVTDFSNIRFTNDRMALTIAFVNSDEDLKKLIPQSIPTLDQLSDVSTETEPTTTAPGGTTVPGETTTTVAGGTTTAASTSAPSTSAPATTTT